MGGLATFLGGNYEEFIEDHKKRDGRAGVDAAMGDRHSHTDISPAVLGARLHIIKIKIDSQLSIGDR